jgi:biotin-independent malonate decarboxylase gamma subunit
MSRGQTWLRALAERGVPSRYPSLEVADGGFGGDAPARILAIVPDPGSRFPRARAGQVGVAEGVALARAVREVVSCDRDFPEDRRRPIVALVDVPSQAYGRLEETLGHHLYLAAAVDAYATARVAGHPIVTLVVGSAISGGFLAHGLQGNQILALDDPGIEIHAMHKPAAARITQRTIEELDEFAKLVPPLSYDVRDWATLGQCDALLSVSSADRPTDEDVQTVRTAVSEAIVRARSGPRDLTNRLASPEARSARAASIAVRQRLDEQWA